MDVRADRFACQIFCDLAAHVGRIGVELPVPFLREPFESLGVVEIRAVPIVVAAENDEGPNFSCACRIFSISVTFQP